MGARCFCRLNNFIIGGIKTAVANIFHNRAGKKVSILQYHCDIFSEAVFAVIFNIFAVKKNCAGLDFVKTVNQIGDSGFAGTCRADKCNFLSFLSFECDILKHLFIGIIAKGNTI